MSSDTPPGPGARANTLKIVKINEATVRDIVRALMPTQEWRLALAEYVRQSERVTIPQESLSPEQLAPILQAILAAVQTHVEFRNKTKIQDLAKAGFPKVLVDVIARQARKLADANRL